MLLNFSFDVPFTIAFLRRCKAVESCQAGHLDPESKLLRLRGSRQPLRGAVEVQRSKVFQKPSKKSSKKRRKTKWTLHVATVATSHISKGFTEAVLTLLGTLHPNVRPYFLCIVVFCSAVNHKDLLEVYTPSCVGVGGLRN